MTRDMSAPNWARTYPRLMRYVLELREHGCQVILPPNFDQPPSRRAAGSGAGVAVMLGEHGPELLLDTDGKPLL